MNNPIQFVQAMRNPQQFLQQIMNNNQVNQNPMAKNALEMFQKGDSKGLEELARNLCTEKGVKPEDVFKQIKSQFGM